MRTTHTSLVCLSVRAVHIKKHFHSVASIDRIGFEFVDLSIFIFALFSMYQTCPRRTIGTYRCSAQNLANAHTLSHYRVCAACVYCISSIRVDLRAR